MNEYDEWKKALRNLCATDPRIQKESHGILQRIWGCDGGETFGTFYQKAKREMEEQIKHGTKS